MSALDLFTRHRPAAEAVARTFGRRYPWLLDDLASDALLKLWKLIDRGKLQAAEHPAALVRLAVRRVCLRRLQVEQKRNPLAFRRQPDLEDFDPLAGVPDRGRDTPDPDAAGVLARALAGLTPAARELVRRHVVEGESYATIGAERGVTGSAVRQQVGKVLRRMRKAAGVTVRSCHQVNPARSL